MKSLKNLFSGILYSFPIQLLWMHLRTNPILMTFWGVLFLFPLGALGKKYGLQNLFLDAEYHGDVSFWSFFFIGLCFSAFLMAWNITTYMLNSSRFPFLASLQRPFAKFCTNNSLIPLAWIITYLVCLIRFQWYNQYAAENSIFFYCMGFLTGVVLGLVIASIYFYTTNKNLFGIIKKDNLLPLIMRDEVMRREEAEVRQSPYRNAWTVKYYITDSFRLRPVRSVEHYNPALLLKVFRQNHANALIIQVFAIVILLGLSLLLDHPLFMIPAIASALMLFAVFVSLIGAFSYWLQEWFSTGFILLLFLVNWISGTGIIKEYNLAYGLDYTCRPAIYSYERLDSLSSVKQYERDRRSTMKILDNWRLKFDTSALARKPKMVFVCASGGGLKAGVWTMTVLQKADSLLKGQLMEHTALMTGASGGMLGCSYYRELCLQKKLGHIEQPFSYKYNQKLAADLLNPMIFSAVVNDFFVPWQTFRLDGKRYHKDRGYLFEQQLIRNTDGLLDKRLEDYYQPEQSAQIPLMFLTPVTVNDGRKVIISPQRVSYMTKPNTAFRRDYADIDAIDFGQFFSAQNAYRLRFTSALRMNATYPYILPNVYLPSEPMLEMMDAGFVDNYGLSTALRFADVFKVWIQNNTSGIIILQIRDSDRRNPIPADAGRGVISRMLSPISVARLFLDMQSYNQDNIYNHLVQVLGGSNVNLVRFVYKPTNPLERASLSFHLTAREKLDIINSFYHKDNQKSLRELKELVR